MLITASTPFGTINRYRSYRWFSINNEKQVVQTGFTTEAAACQGLEPQPESFVTRDPFKYAILNQDGAQVATLIGVWQSFKCCDWRVVSNDQVISNGEGKVVFASKRDAICNFLIAEVPQEVSVNTFKEMDEALSNWRQGLISTSELLLVLQMSPTQVETILNLHKLPITAYSKISLSDLDS